MHCFAEPLDCTEHNCMNGGTPVEKDGCCVCECCEGYSGDHCEVGEEKDMNHILYLSH